ncbi:MG2 domain-containing protein [Hymenobacter actinosclerus]|uniref:TonB-dependent Receptor Plug Domain n=1 Tax=Hymenobacter actinosclerus TaxID=82805 RepID=A0A1I0DU56_9BACT|nr:MG2 domain-containing protein [Hymenobacter actinosclerus]SET35990.1 TonB-dependent Receptor Plug Domain [Hymenobacter actinosclerus]
MPLPKRNRLTGWLAGCACLLTVAAFQLPSQDSPFRQIIKSLANFYATTLPEKVYLHLDRPYYASGQTVWFKAYVVEADSHRPDTLSKILYVELVSARQAVVARRLLRLEAGVAPGDLALPDTLPAGTYQLRAYTNWMRNAGPAFFFSRPLAVLDTRGSLPAPPATAAKTDLQFFPEGGNLVDELESEVGFRAVDAQGRGVAVQGTILDARGQEVARFRSQHAGMGTFRLTPAPGQRYRAVVTGPGGTRAEYALPASEPAGYVLRVSETDADFMVTIRRRPAPGEAPPAGPALLLGQVRGQVSYAVQVAGAGATPVAVRLPKAKFPAGLAHLTLFDEQGTAQCERLVFVPNPPGVRLALTSDKPTYGPREAVRLRLKATDAAGQPVAGQFSVAVTAGSPTETTGPTIVSHLLLSSDLVGPVEAPEYYVQEPQTPEIRQALNALLLTQGWRRFVWKALLAGPLPAPGFLPEQALTVSGQVLTAAGQPAVRTVSYLQTNPTREARMQTEADGRFRFRGLDGLDTTQVMLRAQTVKGERELMIRLLAPPAIEPLVPATPLAAPGSPAAAALAAYARASQQQRADEKLVVKGAVALGNVDVRGNRVKVTDDVIRPYAVNSAAVVLDVSDLKAKGDSRTVMQYLQGRVAGVTITGGHANIRNALNLADGSKIEALYVIDGVIVPAEVIANYPIGEVQSIDVMKQSAAGLFGTQGAGGVIAVHSRTKGILLDPNPKDAFMAARTGVLSVQVPGYYRAREFYAPRYEAAASAAKPDPRYTTLYWAPMVQTDASGQAQLSFYTSDAGGSFNAIGEGLSTQGTPLHGSTSLNVQLPAAR